MKKVLFDANVILDVMLSREGLHDSSKIAMSFAEKRIVVGFVPVTSIPVIFYRVEKQKGKITAENLLKELILRFGIASADEKSVAGSLNAGFDDFEDALVYSVAVNNEMDYLVTRDKKGFKHARSLRVLSPEEFVALM
jgi:predicted nucleic acid-binding protein